jgi:hypothetical protein
VQEYGGGVCDVCREKALLPVQGGVRTWHQEASLEDSFPPPLLSDSTQTILFFLNGEEDSVVVGLCIVRAALM